MLNLFVARLQCGMYGAATFVAAEPLTTIATAKILVVSFIAIPTSPPVRPVSSRVRLRKFVDRD